MTKAQAINLAKKTIQTYYKKGMVADAILWESILDAIFVKARDQEDNN